MKLTEPKYFKTKWGLALLFLPLSLIYIILDFLNKLFSHPYKSKATVICVGNITLGGVGKTPIVIKLGEYFKSKDKKIGILSRGYGGKISSNIPVIIDTKTHTALDVGDEPYLIASKLKGIPVCICKNRKNGAKLLERSVDIIIMDDGFQNYKLKQNIKLCVFDAWQGIGNGYVFPSGPLRSSLNSVLNNIDAIIMMRGKNPTLETKISRPNIPIIYGKTTSNFDFKKYQATGVIAFAGIGQPSKFYKSLKDNGLKLVDTIDFPDHYKYTKEDIDMLKRLSNVKKLPLLTTMKDYVKIPEKDKKYFTPIDIDIAFQNENSLFNIFKKL